MAKSAYQNGRASSMPSGLLTGLAAGMGAILLGTAIIALLVHREVMSVEKIGYGIMGMLLAASAVSAHSACRRIKRQRMVVCLLSAVILWLSLLALTALFFGGQYDGALVTGGLILCGSGCVMLLGGREKRGGNRRNRRNKHR